MLAGVQAPPPNAARGAGSQRPTGPCSHPARASRAVRRDGTECGPVPALEPRHAPSGRGSRPERKQTSCPCSSRGTAAGEGGPRAPSPSLSLCPSPPAQSPPSTPRVIAPDPGSRVPAAGSRATIPLLGRDSRRSNRREDGFRRQPGAPARKTSLRAVRSPALRLTDVGATALSMAERTVGRPRARAVLRSSRSWLSPAEAPENLGSTAPTRRSASRRSARPGGGASAGRARLAHRRRTRVGSLGSAPARRRRAGRSIEQHASAEPLED